MAVGPNDEQRRQQPQRAAEFEDGHGRGEQQPGEKIGTVEGEGLRHGGGRECGGERSIEAGAPAPRKQSDQPAERGQRDGSRRHDGRDAAGAPHGVEDDLRQPFVGQVELARAGFAGIGVARAGGGPGKRVGDGKRMLLHDVLAGEEVPPEIGIVDFPREETQHQQGAEANQERAHRHLPD